MSFKGIKDQLVSRLGNLGYRESKDSWNFENASAREYESTFIIIPTSGELEEGSSLVDKFDDSQVWQIQVAFGKSAHSDILQRDTMSRKINDIIKDLDNPTNWQGVTNGAKLQEYRSWEVSNTENYYLLTMNLRIIDEITH